MSANRAEFLKLLDELDAALDQVPKQGYQCRDVVINVEDVCDSGDAEVETVWHFDHEEIQMLRAALKAAT